VIVKDRVAYQGTKKLHPGIASFSNVCTVQKPKIYEFRQWQKFSSSEWTLIMDAGAKNASADQIWL
jgi:hypothetical protein